jgi:hypothetical protein
VSADSGRKLEGAEAFVNAALATKPELRIQEADLPATVRELRDHLAKSDRVFDRDVPVLVVTPSDGGSPPLVKVLKPNNVIIEAHRFCQPVRRKKDGWIPTTVPQKVAAMYLDMWGERNLRPLAGITTAPLLAADGSIRTLHGYDPATAMWCINIPEMGPMVPMTPMRSQANAALHLVRDTFKTFVFADAERARERSLGVDVVDISKPPGKDESSFLVALLTAMCRPSLRLGPGVLVSAPAISGAGSGKGLLVRAISMIAFGTQPRAFTAGRERQELDKRLAAEFVEASPVVFLDNANGMTLSSDTLASIMTERPARVRILGLTRMVEVNSTAFIAATGNALLPSGDLARRFIVCELDARCEDPEARPFEGNFLETIRARRTELLAAALTIWRWGIQNAADIRVGKPLGSFEDWTKWCRDPLVALGCQDPVSRIADEKKRDPGQQNIIALFQLWWTHHRSWPMKASELAEPVVRMIDPQGRGRQFVTARLNTLARTRAGGFVLDQQKPAGNWGATTYALKPTTAQGTPSGAGYG